jgi:hypothetical protein
VQKYKWFRNTTLGVLNLANNEIKGLNDTKACKGKRREDIKILILDIHNSSIVLIVIINTLYRYVQ